MCFLQLQWTTIFEYSNAWLGGAAFWNSKYATVVIKDQYTTTYDGLKWRSQCARLKRVTAVDGGRPRSNVCQRGERSKKSNTEGVLQPSTAFLDARILRPSPAFAHVDGTLRPLTVVTCRIRPQWERYFSVCIMYLHWNTSDVHSCPCRCPICCETQYCTRYDMIRNIYLALRT